LPWLITGTYVPCSGPAWPTTACSTPGVDLDWVIDTSSILAAAETYLLVTRMLGWDLDTYEEWLATTGIRLCAPAGGVPAGGGAPLAGGPPGGAPPPG
jgi:hypothetical protein